MSGFEIADKAVAGMSRVRLKPALGDDARRAARGPSGCAGRGDSRYRARVGSLSGDPYRLASKWETPPAHTEGAATVAALVIGNVTTAVRLVAALNGDVKGVAANADYVLEKAVREVAQLAAGGGHG